MTKTSWLIVWTGWIVLMIHFVHHLEMKIAAI